MDKKTYLRTIAKQYRKKINIPEISHQLCTLLRNMDFYRNAGHIMIYYPLKYEINTLELLEDEKKFYLPKVSHDRLLVCPYTDELEVSKFNVKEPCTNPVNPKILDLIIVPALMADKKNYRLGYGGGFYDRFLAQYPKIKTVTLLPKKLCVDKLPHDDFDIPVDHVLSL